MEEKTEARAVNIEILPDAQNDLEEGVAFYDQTSRELGEKFFDHLTGQIHRLRRTYGTHRLWQRRYHRFVTDQRFPFVVYYSFDTETIFIHAVLDARRNPERFHTISE